MPAVRAGRRRRPRPDAPPEANAGRSAEEEPEAEAEADPDPVDATEDAQDVDDEADDEPRPASERAAARLLIDQLGLNDDAARAAAGVSLLAVATYDTDYVLVRDDDLDRASRSLAHAGYRVLSSD